MITPVSHPSHCNPLEKMRLRLAGICFGTLLLKSRAVESMPSGLKPELDSSVCLSICKERPNMERTCGVCWRGCKFMGVNTKVGSTKVPGRRRRAVKGI